MSQVESDNQFSGWRKALWPIHGHELSKLIPMSLISFLICFNYSLLRSLKDTLVITAAGSGAEVIPFLKVWGILPAAILSTIFFTKLANRYSRNQVFYLITSCFLIYFALFAFALYPARSVLHPHQFADYLQGVLPAGAKGLVAMVRNWTCTSFYIIAELWATMVLGVLFWGFANEITKVTEAKRFYGVLGMGSNIAAAVAGQTGIFLSFSTYQTWLPMGETAWEQTLAVQIVAILLSGSAILCLFRHVTNTVPEAQDHDASESLTKKKKKPRLSFSQSIAYLAQSRYLLSIAVIVIAYNLVINLIEVIWKHEVKLLYPTPTDYNALMNLVTTYIGIISCIVALFMPVLLHRLGWTLTALITPIILLGTGAGFFGFMYMPEHWTLGLAQMLASTPLFLIVFFGAAQNGLSKAAKYSVFDTTKEIAFIPLDKEEKIKGKAAIDGIGSRFAKSGGSLIQQGLLMVCGTLPAIGPYVAVIVLLAIVGWIFAVRYIGVQFAQLESSHETQQVTSQSAQSSAGKQEGSAQPQAV